ncbi:Glu/Leu/Phe/Val dehydrogenase [Maritimibacter sp. 55A14]|uniref:Glu/Leu/Phe/Val family dehydrogenase n=1 Tax=Maritimibacter sp. 55A14 TaxID=2174844 RepID=UPI000D610AB5|nr:Glu/Leu/Phe/Val dehydrogenase [Maritimibacter sp. 55A14]PWE33025.1 Glu/Leu/Phe/Val dehydrogenase [Maritimibacter sp. 55A14]
MATIFEMADDLGPEKVLHVSNPGAGLRAIVVLDNTAAGPAIGGVRMAPDATLEECARLARAMSLKNAAAGLPNGGGKSVIVADPAMPPDAKESVIRAFAEAIAPLSGYIPGPDMGTNETCMAWVQDEIGRAVGLPRVVGGIPLDEIGATGYGVAVAAAVAEEFCDVPLDGARVAIQGYGAVGRHAARCLAEHGARIVAVADSHGSAFAPDGFDLVRLDAIKADGRSVTDYPGADAGDRKAVIVAECDILVPAARPDAIDSSNTGAIKARLVVEGANIPATAESEAALHERGVLVIPDFIANAGGVICGSVEYRGGTESQALAVITERIRHNTREVFQRVNADGVLPRDAANSLAEARLRQAMALRRSF